jgi:hypothetical protein
MREGPMIELSFDQFEWQRPARRKQGFSWEGDQRRLVGVPGAAFVGYRPSVALFRDFADLDGTAEAVLGFANRYGRLGPANDHTMDYLDSWRDRSGEMRQLVTLGDALSGGDGKKIRDALGTLTKEDLRVVAERRNTPGARVTPLGITAGEYAHAALARIGYVLLTRRGFFENLTLEGDWGPKAVVQARFRHDHLWGFMLFQFGMSLIDGRRFRRCEGCGKWFPLAPSVNRADRTTCSGSCRFQQYRRRRLRAVELYDAGKTVKQIAKELGSEVETVKGWVTGRKEK